MKKIISILTGVIIALSAVIPVMVPVIAESGGTALTGLYNESNYKTYGQSGYNVDFVPSEKAIKFTAGKQAKALLKYSTDMTTFSSSMVVQGNSTGLIYSGITFHLQEDDFENAVFNTAGYSIILIRGNSSTPADKCRVIMRYCSGNNAQKEITTEVSGSVLDANDKTLRLRLDLEVTETTATVKVYNEAGTECYLTTHAYDLDYTATQPSTKFYPSGALGFLSNGVNTISNISVTSYGKMQNIPEEEEDPVVLSDLYTLYGSCSTNSDGYTTTSSSIARGILKDTTVTDFSAELQVKANDSGGLKSGIVFRSGSVGAATDQLEGYQLILQKMDDASSPSKVRLYLYKYGVINGEYKYLGRIAYVENTSVLGYYNTSVSDGAGQILTIHMNVVGDKLQAYFYGNTNPNDPTEVRRSQLLSTSLKELTDNEKGTAHPEYAENFKYYTSGGVGYYVSKNMLIDAFHFTVGEAEVLLGEDDYGETTYQGGTSAVYSKSGKAVKGKAAAVSGLTPQTTAPVTDIAAYSSDFDHYTLYSSSSSSKFYLSDEGITSSTTGTKRAILDGVTVKGFHASTTMKIGSEGTLRSGFVFRVNNLEDDLTEDGVLAAEGIESYAIILYKTPGTTESHARVVMCIYKYGKVDGRAQFLGTISSKASEVPLAGCEAKITDAAGKKLTLDVNVIDDTLTAYFYDADNPSKKSEKLVAELTKDTDNETSTPSLKGVYYAKGGIGLVAQNYVTFTDVLIEEPIYPSNAVGMLNDLDSYTLYGSGVSEENGYFVANSSGTKKLMVNNLTVSDFKASVDMTIDNNGNLKAGFFFRASEVGNGADDQCGWAIIVTRNYATLGDTNPNRIDIVVFKWGYSNGKLAYLGEVAREAFKSGSSFMDGKMANEELTFVVNVQGASLDATLYQKSDMTNKPLTFSTNLKFAAGKEKTETVYYESGSIGLYLGNNVSDPLNYTKLRNFQIDDGSGVKVTAAVSRVSRVASALGVSPSTGETFVINFAAYLFLISGFFLCRMAFTRGKRARR